MGKKWIVQVKGENGMPFEISVIREDNMVGVNNFGFFSEKKLLISQGLGGQAVVEIAWTALMHEAEKLAALLNQRGTEAVYK